MKVKWSCPECAEINENDLSEVEAYCQICNGCGKEFDVDTDDLTVIAIDIHKIDD